MIQNEIIELARQAGFFVKDSEAYSPSVQEDHELTPCLERFTKLTIEKEREACARVCDLMPNVYNKPAYPSDCAAAIRARGQT